MRNRCFAVCMILCCVFSGVSIGAEDVSVWVVGESQGWIQGESQFTSMGRENTIQAFGYSHMLAAEPDPETGLAGKAKNHFPLTILKRIDKASPRLFKAWRKNESLNVTLRFYRPNPIGDGTTQQFYTVILQDALISGLRREVRSTLEPGQSTYPPIERVSFTYRVIEERWESDEFEFGDEWRTDTGKIPLCDVNFDGIVNMNDFAILADEWMTQY